MGQPVPTEAIVAAWLDRAGAARLLPANGRTILVPDLGAAAAAWREGAGQWAATPRPPEWQDHAGRPVVGLTDNGKDSDAVVAVEIRKINRKDYRGKSVLIAPKMAEVRIHKLWRRAGRSGGPGGTVEAVLPYVLGQGWPRRADRGSGHGHLDDAVALLLSLDGDARRRWEAVSGEGGRLLDVASASGRPRAEGEPGPPLIPAEGGPALAAAAFDPVNSADASPNPGTG